MKKPTQSSHRIEALEPRIAPAAVLTFTEADGDIVKITTSKGDNAALDTAVALDDLGGGRFELLAIVLTIDPVFDGTSLKITATRGPTGGDGFTMVPVINAVGRDLGAVFVDGELRAIDAGKGTPTSRIGSITAVTTSTTSDWDLAASVGSIRIKGDVRDVEINVTGASLGSFIVGGSMIGTQVAGGTALLNVPNGKVNVVKIGHDLFGYDGTESARLSAKEFGTITIGGSIFGGDGARSGSINVGTKCGAIKIGGSVVAGAGLDSGTILAKGAGNENKIGVLQIGGSVIGGTVTIGSGTIRSEGVIGTLGIGGDLVGLAPDQPVEIRGQGVLKGDVVIAAIQKLTVGGRVENAFIVGGFGQAFGYTDGQLGTIKVKGDWIASSVIASVGVGDDGLRGTDDDAAPLPDTRFAKIKSISIGGVIRGTALPNDDHFGFVSEEIGSFTVGGTKIPLNKGRKNDNVGTNLPGYELGLTDDVTIREV